MGIKGEKGEGFAGTIIKDTWTITNGVANKGGRWGVLGSWGVLGRKGRKLYFNNNKKFVKKKKNTALNSRVVFLVYPCTLFFRICN